MKYIVILLAVLLIIRIDVFMHLFDQTSERVQKFFTPSSQPPTVAEAPEIIPLNEDRSFKQNPKRTLLMLLTEFKVNPESAIRLRIISIIKENPSLLGIDLDPRFESAVFGLRDLIYQKEKELPLLLLDLLKVLKGENREMVRKFFSLMMDNDLTSFLQVYSQAKDENCMIASQLGDELPEQEKLNELKSRLASLEKYLEREDVSHKLLASNCQLVVQIQINKISPPVPEGNNDSDN